MEESVVQIPDRMEYNMVKAALLGQKGYYHVAQGEYEKAEEDYREAVGLMEQTVDEHSRRLALEYYRLASNYSYREEWDRAWNCLEKAIPGFRQATPYSKGNVSQGLGIICQELNKEEEAKRYYLKAYLHQKEAARRVGLPYVEASLENSLFVYSSDNKYIMILEECSLGATGGYVNIYVGRNIDFAILGCYMPKKIKYRGLWGERPEFFFVNDCFISINGEIIDIKGNKCIDDYYNRREY